MKTILRFVIPGVILLMQGSAYSQDLPKGLTPEEVELMPGYLNSRASSGGFTTPPSSPVRTMAEWEEIQALVITWTSYQSTLREVVRNAKLECRVIIICSDSIQVKTYLAGYSINSVNLSFIQAPYNSVWIRDYFANTVYTNDVDSLLLVDWIYNRPRPKDDTIPSVLANYLNIPIYETTTSPNNVVHSGGNFMADGFGTGFSSKLVLTENSSKSEAQIDAIMDDFMGINRYIKMTTLPYDGIHHIDMHMKLLDEETLLVGEYPQGVSDGPQIEANLQYVLSNFNSVFGTPYKVVRVVMPPENSSYPNTGGDYRTFTNSIFVNKTILVPIYQPQYDTVALRIYREALPGYNVVGINCSQIIQASGALHCITHSVGVSDPLLISHQALPNTSNTTVPYQVDALIQHKSGIQDAALYYRTDTLQPYVSVPMSFATNNTWTGNIPAKPLGTTVYYYVEAEAVSGKQQVRPLPAPAGYWKFKVLDGTGIQEDQNTLLTFMPAYPNPSKGITCIPVNSTSQVDGEVRLLDILGKEVRIIYQGPIKSGDNNFFLNSESLAPGAYFISVETFNSRNVQKLMVK